MLRGALSSVHVQQALAVLVFLGAWELASGRLVPTLFVSSPSAVLARLYTLIVSGALSRHALATFAQTGSGYAIGFTAGVIVGNILGLSFVLGRFGGPFLTYFYSIPRIAIAPLFIVWFGVGFEFKVAFVAFVVFFIGAIATFGGLRQANRLLVDGARVMGADRWQLFRSAILPQEALWIFTSIRVSFPLAVASDIVAEFLASNVGLGFLMSNAASVLNTTTVLAVVIFLATVVTLVLGALSLIERWRFAWQKGLS